MVRLHPLDPRRAGQRLLYAVLVGAIAWFASPADYSTATRALLAGDVAGVALLGLAGWIVVRSDAAQTRERAAAEDPGRLFVWLVVLAVSTVSLFATTFILHHARTLPAGEDRVVLALGIATGVIAWLLTHTAFTLRYAHLFYRGGASEEGGLTFPDSAEPGDRPDDLDFAYFAFTIGMCFQVSDVQITDRAIRRTVLAHAVLSFAYNTGILALVLNVVVGQLG